MPNAIFCVTGIHLNGTQALVGYSVAVFGIPEPDSFSGDMVALAGLSGVQTSMLLASKVLQDVRGRGHLIALGDVISLSPIQ